MNKQAMWKDHTVAVVEDSQSLSHALADKLHRSGFQVLLASDGKSGLEAVLKQQPSLILLDIMLPAMDGFEFLEILRRSEWGKNVPVLIVSNSENPDHHQKAEQFECVHYFVKAETTIEELIEAVKETLTPPQS